MTTTVKRLSDNVTLTRTGDDITITYAGAYIPVTTAADVTVADAGGYFTGTDVEAALQELGTAAAGDAPTDATYVVLSSNATLTDERVLTAGDGIDLTDAGAGSTITVSAETATDTNPGIVELATTAEAQAGVDTERAITAAGLAAAIGDHTGDTSDAHDASAISILDAADDFTATDVEGALAELQSDHETDAQNLTDHLNDTADAHAASAITNTPAGSIAATTVQAAIDELDSEKAASSHVHAGGDITSGTVGTARLGSGTANSSTFLRGDQTWAAPGGDVATDAIWDAKGDLAVGTGANTAAKLTVGATDGHVLTVDSGEVAGVKWAAGAAGVTWPLAGDADAVGAPNYSWSGDTTTGMYRIGASNIGFALGGSKYVDLSTSYTDFSNRVRINSTGTTSDLIVNGTSTVASGGWSGLNVTDTSRSITTASSYSALLLQSAPAFAASAGTCSAFYGVNTSATVRGDVTVTNGYGQSVSLTTDDTGGLHGTITTGYGLQSSINAGAGTVFSPSNNTISTAVGVDVAITATQGSTGNHPNGIITTAIGLRLTNLNANTAATGSLSGGTVWGMQVGDYQSYHTGRMAFGGTTAPTYQLELQGTGADRGVMYLAESAATPTSPPSSAGVLMYHRADKLIFVFNDGGTVRYKYLTLSGTGVTWTHTTTAPT